MARPRPEALEATMVARTAAMAVLVLGLLCGGCGAFSASRQDARQQPAAMELTADNVSRVRAAVAKVKRTAPRPSTREDYVRFARTVYVDSWAGTVAVAATTETALAKAKAGDVAAREYLTVMVYDLPLQAAMEGVSLSVDDWRAVYVGSGIMTDTAFTSYAALTRKGKVLP